MLKRLEAQSSENSLAGSPHLNGVNGAMNGVSTGSPDSAAGQATPSAHSSATGGAHDVPQAEKQVVQRRQDQRWPYESEPVCVMCGRFAECVATRFS